MLKNKNKKGFTLIELIVVIAIIGILAAIAIPRFSGFQGSANVKAAKTTMQTIQTAIQSVAADKNTTIATVATTDAYLTEVGTLLNWPVSNIAGGRVVTVDPVNPTGAVYSITATGEAQVVVPETTPWKSTVGTLASNKYTATWSDIKDK